MTVAEILQSVQFVVNQDGKPTAAVLDMDAWESFLLLLEEIEDVEIVRARVGTWRAKEGWSPWADFETELAAEADGDESSTVD